MSWATEELEFAEKHGMECKVIPGVTSALSVPALQKIPATHRGANESLWVVTGTTKEGRFSKDMPLAAQSSATVIVLMGMKRLSEIVDLFKIHRGDNEPIAIIQNGSTDQEKSVIGTLKNIVLKVNENNITSPAIITIGEVVNLKHQEDLNFEEAVFNQYFLEF